MHPYPCNQAVMTRCHVHTDNPFIRCLRIQCLKTSWAICPVARSYTLHALLKALVYHLQACALTASSSPSSTTAVDVKLRHCTSNTVIKSGYWPHGAGDWDKQDLPTNTRVPWAPGGVILAWPTRVLQQQRGDYECTHRIQLA